MDSDPVHFSRKSGPDEGVALDAILNYLNSLCPVLLSADPDLFARCLRLPEVLPQVASFCTNDQVPTILIRKIVSDGKEPEFIVTTALNTRSMENQVREEVVSLVVIKSVPVILSTVGVHRQVLITQFDDTTPLKSLLAHVSHVFGPIQNTLRSKPSEADRIRKVGTRIADLKLELLRTQIQCDIPLVSFPIHPAVQRYLLDCADRKSVPDVHEMPSANTDLLLNELQKCVNDWIKASHDITILGTTDSKNINYRNVAYGSTLDEINFWVGLGHAIEHIYTLQESPEVKFTLDILKSSSRFTVVRGFVDKSGLSAGGKETEPAILYSKFLKELVIQPLLSASDLEDVSNALQAIAKPLLDSNLISKYPLERFKALISVLSKDLWLQLETILSTKGKVVMTSVYSDFQYFVEQLEEIVEKWKCDASEALKLRNKREEAVQPSRTRADPIQYSRARYEPISEQNKSQNMFSELEALLVRVRELKDINKKKEKLKEALSQFNFTDFANRKCSL
jgi:hypothetical protein